jgi:ankyrin repeat protein
MGNTGLVAERTLWYAAWSGDVRLTLEMLQDGADPDSRAPDGKTPLMEAVDEPGEFFDASREAVAVALIDGGADVAAQDELGWTALHHAGRAGSRAVELLLGAGADVEVAAHDGTTPLHTAAAQANVEVARALIAAGASPALRDGNGLTPLDVARREHDATELRLLTFLLEGG